MATVIRFPNRGSRFRGAVARPRGGVDLSARARVPGWGAAARRLPGAATRRSTRLTQQAAARMSPRLRRRGGARRTRLTRRAAARRPSRLTRRPKALVLLAGAGVAALAWRRRTGDAELETGGYVADPVAPTSGAAAEPAPGEAPSAPLVEEIPAAEAPPPDSPDAPAPGADAAEAPPLGAEDTEPSNAASFTPTDAAGTQGDLGAEGNEPEPPAVDGNDATDRPG
jgi:hypothetical protein